MLMRDVSCYSTSDEENLKNNKEVDEQEQSIMVEKGDETWREENGYGARVGGVGSYSGPGAMTMSMSEDHVAVFWHGYEAAVRDMQGNRNDKIIKYHGGSDVAAKLQVHPHGQPKVNPESLKKLYEYDRVSAASRSYRNPSKKKQTTTLQLVQQEQYCLEQNANEQHSSCYSYSYNVPPPPRAQPPPPAPPLQPPRLVLPPVLVQQLPHLIPPLTPRQTSGYQNAVLTSSPAPEDRCRVRHAEAETVPTSQSNSDAETCWKSSGRSSEKYWEDEEVDAGNDHEEDSGENLICLAYCF
eukprot:g19667.t1